jgi:hypothetical protein
MKRWLRPIRGAIGMGLTWAVGWGLVGFLFEMILNILPGNDLGHIVDMWPQFLAMNGFLGGVVFSMVLGVAAGRRRFDQLSIRGFGACGALGGLLLGGFATTTGLASGLDPLWIRAAMIIGPPTVLSAASAAGSLALARMAERRSVDAAADLPELTPPGDHPVDV